MAKTKEEIVADLAALRARVEERYPQPGRAGDPGGEAAEFQPPLVDLMPLFHARDAAEGKVAAIGKVNPRRGGPVNALIQAGKRGIARGLGWFIRDQVDFNAAAVRALTETIEALNEANRSLAALAAENRKLRRELTLVEGQVRATAIEADAHLRDATDDLSARIRATQSSIDNVAAGLANETARGAEADLGLNQKLDALQERLSAMKSERDREDIRLLRTLADIQKAVQQQIARSEMELRDALEQRGVVAEERAKSQALEAIARDHKELEAVLHRELRLLRQRVGAILERDGGQSLQTAAEAIASEAGFFDSVRFSDRFRGSDEAIREKLRIYLPHFRDCEPVLDLGCGRGEFLDLLRDEGVAGVGVEANPELAGVVASKGHEAHLGDLFAYLRSREPESAGGVFCAHVIEHLPTETLANLVAESYRVLRSGGVLAFETPNPGCLAIFSTYFYLDPTHVRPVPSDLIVHLLEEQGFVGIDVQGLHPAVEEFEALKPLDDGFRQQFFGHLDYGVFAQKP